MTRAPPLYQSIAQDLRRAIAKGEFGPGALLPTEHALIARYQVSRHTARQALQVLSHEGLIARKRGVGTAVVDAQVDAAFVQPLDTLSALMQYARDARLSVTSIAKPGSSDLGLLDATAPAGWTCIKGLRRTNAKTAPIAVTKIFVRSAICPSRDEIDAHHGALHEWIAARFGIQAVRVEQEIAAVSLTRKAAAELETKPGAPALQIVRRYVGADATPFQISHSLHPGARFTYRMQVIRA